MAIIERIAALQAEMTAWRRHLHAHPETAFEEHDTAAFIAERLASFGVTVYRGLAGTGVIGTLTTGEGPAIGLRADMDALGFEEANDFAHRSTRREKMHACGHDGHTITRRGLLSRGDAALSRQRPFHLPAGGGERGRRAGDG
jgi:amidohydrolase